MRGERVASQMGRARPQASDFSHPGVCQVRDWSPTPEPSAENLANLTLAALTLPPFFLAAAPPPPPALTADAAAAPATMVAPAPAMLLSASPVGPISASAVKVAAPRVRTSLGWSLGSQVERLVSSSAGMEGWWGMSSGSASGIGSGAGSGSVGSVVGMTSGGTNEGVGDAEALGGGFAGGLGGGGGGGGVSTISMTIDVMPALSTPLFHTTSTGWLPTARTVASQDHDPSGWTCVVANGETEQIAGTSGGGAGPI